MSQLLRISPSNPALVLAVSLILSSGVRADNTHGTDAPDTPGTSTSGDDGSSSADNAAGASGSNGGLSKTAQIVIGVVVGVVCLAASMYKKRLAPVSTQNKTIQHESNIFFLCSRFRCMVLPAEKTTVGRANQTLRNHQRLSQVRRKPSTARNVSSAAAAASSSARSRAAA